jgi:hypothetical protein
MIILDTNPDNYLSTEDMVDEQALSLLANFIDKVWTRLDGDEPSIDDYFNF